MILLILLCIYFNSSNQLCSSSNNIRISSQNSLYATNQIYYNYTLLEDPLMQENSLNNDAQSYSVSIPNQRRSRLYYYPETDDTPTTTQEDPHKCKKIICASAFCSTFMYFIGYLIIHNYY
ncbi:hypothetical protein HYV10_00165 [Candidatus Dependentiae bacterium]|nr:hypothetical protein [Candidatus Dependentiae bacterium]